MRIGKEVEVRFYEKKGSRHHPHPSAIHRLSLSISVERMIDMWSLFIANRFGTFKTFLIQTMGNAQWDGDGVEDSPEVRHHTNFFLNIFFERK